MIVSRTFYNIHVFSVAWTVLEHELPNAVTAIQSFMALNACFDALATLLVSKNYTRVPLHEQTEFEIFFHQSFPPYSILIS